MGSAHTSMQAYARKGHHTQYPDYEGWQGESMPKDSPDNPGVPGTDLAAVLLFFSILTIGTFATLLIVW